jgi:hypothetical protein
VLFTPRISCMVRRSFNRASQPRVVCGDAPYDLDRIAGYDPSASLRPDLVW